MEKAVLVICVVVLSIPGLTDGYIEALGASVDIPEAHFEPQVAMVCDQDSLYLNQYMDSSGHWVTDLEHSKGCVKNKEDILAYCKKVYPKHEITNIVESTQSYMIDDWCKVGHGKCEASFWVRPYRCLEGKFQSDALLVPEPCQFDHIHNSSSCWDFDKWNKTASKSCTDHGMKLRSFAMLLPCGTDVFTGVEFVCCPKSLKKGSKAADTGSPFQLTSEVDIEIDDAVSDPSVRTEQATRDPYFTKFDPHVEHDSFKAAERRLEAANRRKITKIMKEWAELEERYQKIKVTNPEKADKFKLRMTDRFQHMMNTIKDQGIAEKHQLVALHQQRIVAHINEKKRDSMTGYVKTLNERPPQAAAVKRYLNRLMRALYKDRHHTISHFTHLLETQPDKAHSQRASTVAHLSDIDRMVNESMQMLDRYPELKAKLVPEVTQEIGALQRRDTLPVELTEEIVWAGSSSQNHLLTDTDDSQLIKEQILEQENRARDKKLVTNQETREELHHVQAAAGGPVHHYDPETMEDESVNQIDIDVVVDHQPASADLHLDPVVSYSQSHEHLQSEAGYSLTSSTPEQQGGSSSHHGMYFTVILASVALSVALVAAGMALYHHHKAPQNLGFIEVDQHISPEERHLAQMQINGYENPTYKYFEDK